MTTHIEIDVPIYRADRYEQLERQGRIKLSSNIETIEEGSLTKEYERLKKEADILVADINARTRLAAEVSELEDQIRWKGNQLARPQEGHRKSNRTLQKFKAFLRKFRSRSQAVTFDF
jgi:hypothetical protein